MSKQFVVTVSDKSEVVLTQQQFADWLEAERYAITHRLDGLTADVSMV